MKASHVTNILLGLIASTQFLILLTANKPEASAESSPLKVEVVETVGYRGGPISVRQQSSGFGSSAQKVQITNWPFEQRVRVR